MGSIVGFAALTFISYLLIIFNILDLFIPFLILTTIILVKPFKKTFKQIKIKPDKKSIIILLVFIIGITGQLLIISPSGIFQNGNLVFWSAHGHDGPWHIALMEEIKKGWPFQNPIFSGEKLINYHYFSDILPAVVSKYLPISNLDLYFRVFPFFYSLFLGASAYFLTKKITNNFQASIWATIFTYFAGSFGFIVTYLKNKTLGGESIFWATQPQSSSGNPPQIVSNFLVLSAIYFLFSLIQEKNKNNRKKIFLVCFLLFGTLASFKIYAGLIMLAALGVTATWQFIKEKKFQLIILTGISGILTTLLYFTNTSESSSFLIFEPWWYIRTMIVEPSRLNLLDWELRRQTYIYEHNWKRVIFLEGVGFLIFFFGNLGTRLLGLWDFLKSHIFFKVAIILSLVFPLLFLQKAVATNTSQFLQYFVLLFGILAGITTSKIVSKIKILTPVIILLMIPTQIGLINEFYSRPAFAKISSHEIEALNYIKNNTDKNDVIITPVYNQYLNLNDAVPNIWDWFDTSYVSAFSSRRTYFDDYEQADIMGYIGKNRIETKKIIFESKDSKEVTKALNQTEVNLLYYPKILKPNVDPEEIGLNLIFENQEVKIWKTNLNKSP